MESSQPKEGIVPLSQDDKAAFTDGQTRKDTTWTKRQTRDCGCSPSAT